MLDYGSEYGSRPRPGGQQVRPNAIQWLGAVLLVPGMAAVSGPLEPVADEHTLQLWQFDEGEGLVTRESVGGGEAVLPADAAWRRGRHGGALRFPGNGPGLRLPGEGVLPFGPGSSFTVEAWVKVHKTGATQQIVQCTPHVELEIRSEHGGVSFNLAAPGRGVHVRCTGETDITDGKWHHVAGVRDGARKKVILYLDGLLDAQADDATAGETVFLYRGPVVAGKGSRDGEALGGRVDAIRISSIARNFEE